MLSFRRRNGDEREPGRSNAWRAPLVAASEHLGSPFCEPSVRVDVNPDSQRTLWLTSELFSTKVTCGK